MVEVFFRGIENFPEAKCICSGCRKVYHKYIEFPNIGEIMMTTGKVQCQIFNQTGDQKDRMLTKEPDH